MLGFLIHYSKGLRLLGFQLFGFYCKASVGDLEQLGVQRLEFWVKGLSLGI